MPDQTPLETYAKTAIAMAALFFSVVAIILVIAYSLS